MFLPHADSGIEMKRAGKEVVMKKVFCLFTVVYFSVVAFTMAAPAISLQANQSKKSTRVTNRWGDTDRVQSQEIDISLRNMSSKPEEITVQWLFIARNEQVKKLWTYSYDAAKLVLNGGQSTNFIASSDTLVAKSYDMYFGSHSKPFAYVVVAFQGETILKCVANSQALQTKCSKWAGFEEMLNSKLPEEFE